MKTNNNPTLDYSSKIKNILIELHGYTFFHSPSEIDNIDKRFIGRKDIIEKLKAILTDDETRSGSYLIASYRGMGKSSFVSKTISEVISSKSRSRIFSRFFRILLLLILLPFLQVFNDQTEFVSFGIPCSVFILSFFWLVISDHHVPDLKKGFLAKSSYYASISLRTLLIERGGISAHRFRRFVQDFYILSIIQIIALILFSITDIDSFSFRAIVYLFIFIFYILITIFINELIDAKITSLTVVKESPDSITYLSSVAKRVLSKILRYLNYSHRDCIKMNLGYDDLREIDVLRLIARNILQKYQEKTSFSFSFPDMSSKVIKFILLFFLTSFIYYSETIYNINQAFKETIGITDYFPSQNSNERKKLIKFLKRENTRENQDFIEDYINGQRINNDEHPPLKVLARYFDLSIFTAYYKLINNIPLVESFKELKYNQVEHYFYKNTVKFNNNFMLIPGHIDYLVIFYFLLFYMSAGFVFRYRLFGIITNGGILKKLKYLNDLIDAEVISDDSRNINAATSSYFRVGLFSKKQKNYPRADIREIEKQLIEILNDMDSLPFFLRRPEFIFIFDELDKIEPRKSSKNNDAAKDSDPDEEELFFSTEGARRRQHTILKLLSNLKYLFTTAKSKFLFIAGRELYDLTLADVSDRDFFVGSFFNDVIYVDSFLTDSSDEKLADITSMAEMYVCNFILPYKYRKEGCSLKVYNKYLKEYFSKEEDQYFAKEKRKKIIFCLQNFITYLTYRSTGSPKKLTRFFEDYIVKRDKEELKDSLRNLRVGWSSNSLYLCFEHHDQYTFGQITYLANPLVFSINRAIKDFGDKLRVSTTFLVDHIYKFHGFGFSWQNLELTPEVVDINKSPQLREVIENIMNFLSKTHIQEIFNGLYRYKFSQVIVEEISYLSKISEKESAAFNFTLDESLMIDRHYKKQLKHLNSIYKDEKGNEKSNNLKSSIVYTHLILGDLYFYDEKYNDAIIEYLEATKNLPIKHDESNNLLILIILSRLKLGFAYEKNKDYKSALIVYGEISGFVFSIFKDKKEAFIRKNNIKNLRGLDQFEYFCNYSSFESIRLLYQPLLAKFHVIEKSKLGGITWKEINEIEKETKLIIKIIDPHDRPLIESEILNKIGDILYYKGSRLSDFDWEVYCCGASEDVLCFPNKLILENIKNKVNKYDSRVPCAACLHYMKAFKIVCHDYFEIPFEKLNNRIILSLFKKLEVIHTNLHIPQKSILIKSVGNLLSDIGDTFLSCTLDDEDLQKNGFLDLFLDIVDEESYGKKADMIERYIENPKINRKSLNKIEEVFLYYYLSAIFYQHASELNESSFQILKILYTIRGCIGQNLKVETMTEEIVNRIGSTIVKRALRGYYRTYDNISRNEIKKFESIFDDIKQKDFLNNISLSSDYREVIATYNDIRLRSKKIELSMSTTFTSPYLNVNNMYNRVLELRFKTDLNLRFFEQLGFDSLDEKMGITRFVSLFHGQNRKIKKIFGKEFDARAAMEYLITDSIYCLHELIKIRLIFNITYNINNYVIAKIHFDLSIWCSYYYAYCNLSEEDDKSRITELLTSLIGSDSMDTIDEYYHLEKALEHSYAELETHSEGRTYRNMIEKMYYLNDDFNDNLYHFFAGMDRYRINSGRINKIIKEVKEKLKDSKLYDVQPYLDVKREGLS